MMATSGTSVVRACTARTASGIIRPVGCRAPRALPDTRLPPPAAPPPGPPPPAEILPAQRLGAAQAAAELLLPHVEWGEVERGLGHVAPPPPPGRGVSAPPARPAPPAPS